MRAARAWALGGTCEQCPRAPVFPARCVEEEPIEWRDDAADEGGTWCPVFLWIERQSALKTWTMAERGHLPRAGGWQEQDAIVIEQIDIIGAAVERAKAQRAAEAAAQGEH